MTRRPIAPPSQLTLTPSQPEQVASQPAVEPVTVATQSAPLAVREVLGFPIRWLLELPLPTSLLCSVAHEGGLVLLATGLAAPVPTAMPAFVGPEISALALAAEHDRATHVTMRAWIAKKPDWRLTSIEALGKLGHKVEPLGWSTGQVLRALGLQLDEVWL